MRSLMKRALEDYEDSESKTIIMKGPLADVYTKALDIAYAKLPELTTQDETTAPTTAPADAAVPEIAAESQQMDVAVLQKLNAELNDADAPPTDNFQTVYGVSRDDLTEDTVVEVTSELAKAQDAQDFFLVIDATDLGEGGGAPGQSTEKIESIGRALECMVEAHGGRVFTSIDDFIKATS